MLRAGNLVRRDTCISLAGHLEYKALVLKSTHVNELGVAEAVAGVAYQMLV
jgi:hypothetical protein